VKIKDIEKHIIEHKVLKIDEKIRKAMFLGAGGGGGLSQSEADARYLKKYRNILVVGTGDNDYPTITEATAVAESGDLIIVKPGTYTESITLPDGVDIEGIGVVTISQTGLHSHTIITTGTHKITNLVVTSTGASGQAISDDATSSNVIIENCDLRGNFDSIFVFADSVWTLNNCILRGNYDGSNIQGIVTFNDCNFLFVHTINTECSVVNLQNGTVVFNGQAYDLSKAKKEGKYLRLKVDNLKSGLNRLKSNEAKPIFVQVVNNKQTVFSADLEYQKISPGKYKIHVEKDGLKLLTFYQNFDRYWRIYQDDSLFSRAVSSDDKHLIVDSYANGWLIDTDKFNGDLYIIYWPDRLLVIGGFLTITILVLMIVYLAINRHGYEI